MAFTYFDFDFKYVGNKGKPSTGTLRGNIKDDGLTLGEEVLYFQYIFDTAKDYNDLVLVLYPGLAAGNSITSSILSNSNSLVLRIDPEMLPAVKSQIDRKYTAIQARLRKEKMARENNVHNYKACNCPVCDSTIDLSLKADTLYVYCKYCETIFNKHRHLFTGADKYALCYECGYYSQVKHYSGLGAQDTKEFCINCAEDHIGNDWTAILKRPLHLIAKIQTQQEANPHFRELDRANKAGRERNLEKAESLYNNMLLHVKSYPALHYNFGKIFLDAAISLTQNATSQADLRLAQDYITKAAGQLEMAVKACSTYKPALDLLKKYGELPFVKK